MLQNYVGFLGIALIYAFMYVWSDHRQMIPWRMVIIGLPLSFALGLLALRLPGTSDALGAVGSGAQRLSGFAMKGAEFVLGDTLAYGKFLPTNQQGEWIFGIQISFTIIFVCGMCEMLYYAGILPFVVKSLSYFVRKLGLGGAEALSCTATPVLGQVESQLLIKHMMPKLTPSALFTCMTASMAGTAGATMLLYMSIGLKPQWLITASVMNCFHGIILSKMKRPELHRELLEKGDVEPTPSSATGIFDAAEKGAMHGARIALAVIVMVAFSISLLELCNWAVSASLGTFGINTMLQSVFHLSFVPTTLPDILALPFVPVVFLFGVPWHNCFEAARLIATGSVFNEVIAMIDFMKEVKAGGLSDRTQLLLTCAITIFAHPGSIGIQIGGLSAMAPERRAEIASNAPRAMVVATMAAWLTACVCSIIF